MASSNKKAAIVSPAPRTHKGAVAARITPEQELQRTIMACMLWEDNFHESGQSVADRISELVKKVEPVKVLNLAIKARAEQHLRHAGLYLVAELERAFKTHTAKNRIAETLETIVQRPDELAEFLALYWRDKKPNGAHTPPLTAQAKKGLAAAFSKFSPYQLAKYNNQSKSFKLKDVFRLVHPTTTDAELWAVWKKLLDGTLESPDTWEVQLSAGKDKKETFTRLIDEKKLGVLALLRNLRNMQEANVDDKVMRQALLSVNPEKALPFRFISAAKYAPKFEAELEQMMFKCLAETPKLNGKTVLLIDCSGSMTTTVSGKSDISRLDAACGVAMLLREICESVVVLTFSDDVKVVPSRRGFALRAAIGGTRGGTNTRGGVEASNKEGYDRLIVITDEQSDNQVPAPLTERAYFINVASYQNGIGYGPWTHIDGWSEAIVNYITAAENQQ